MINQSFYNGFIKNAQAHGIKFHEAVAFLKIANPNPNPNPSVFQRSASGTPVLAPKVPKPQMHSVFGGGANAAIENMQNNGGTDQMAKGLGQFGMDKSLLSNIQGVGNVIGGQFRGLLHAANPMTYLNGVKSGIKGIGDTWNTNKYNNEVYDFNLKRQDLLNQQGNLEQQMNALNQRYQQQTSALSEQQNALAGNIQTNAPVQVPFKPAPYGD